MVEISASPVATEPPRPPRGYVPRLALAQFGLYLAILAPVSGGLSVKIQHLVGLAAAPAQLGLVSGTGAVFAMVCQPLAGRLSDRCTARLGMRRPFVIGGAIGLTVGLIGCAVAPSVPVLLVAWCAAQAAANFAFAATSATIADQVPDARRGGVSGIVGAMSLFGVLVGASLLSVLPTDVLRFVVPGFVGLVLGLWFALRLRDRVRTERPTQRLGLRSLVLSFVFNPRRYPDLGWAWLSKFCLMLGYTSLSSYLTLFLATDFGLTDTSAQLRFNALANIVSMVTVVLFSVGGGFVSDRIGRRKPFVIAGALVMALALALIAFTPALHHSGLTALLVLQAVLGIGAGLFLSVDNALCLHLLPDPDDTAKDLGVLNIANTLPQSLSPFLAGIVVIPIGNALFHGAGFTVWFLVGGVLCAIGAALVTRIRNAR